LIESRNEISSPFGSLFVEQSHPIHIVENAIDKRVLIDRFGGSSFWDVFHTNRPMTSS
jgi:hypothetical protein